MTYTPLGELATATEKARRDAPSIAVCEVWTRTELRICVSGDINAL